MSHVSLATVERVVDENLDALPPEAFEFDSSGERLYLDVERRFERLYDDHLTELYLQVEDELYSFFPNYAEVGPTLESRGIFALGQSTDFLDGCLVWAFRERVAERVEGYSPEQHRDYLRARVPLDEKTRALAPAPGDADQMELCRELLSREARVWSAPGLRGDHYLSDNEKEYLEMHHAWAGIVEHVLPIYDQSRHEQWEKWAFEAGQRSLQHWLMSYFRDELERFEAIARRLSA